MTRGTLILIDKESIHIMPEINGDMHPQRRGFNIIGAYLQNKIKSANDLHKLYKEILKSEYEEDVERYTDIMSQPFSNAFDKRYLLSDYLYIVNNGPEDVFFTNGDSRGFKAKKGKLTIAYYDEEAFVIERKKTYEVILKDEDIVTLEKALDFYMRLWMGQYYHITYDLRFDCHKKYPKGEFIDALLLAIRVLVMPELATYPISASHGISDPEVDVKGRLSYEILKTIRHNRSYCQHPEGGWTVDFDEPSKVTDLPFPLNETHKDGDKVISTTQLHAHHLSTIFEALSIYLCYLSKDYKGLFSHVTNDPIALSLAKTLTDYLHRESDFQTNSKYQNAQDVNRQVINQILGVPLFKPENGDRQ